MVNFLVPQIGQSFAAGAQVAEQSEDRKLARENQALVRQENQQRLRISADANERENQKAKNDLLGRVLHGFQQMPQDQQVANWGRLKNDLTQAGFNPDDMPPGYDPGYIAFNLSKSMSIADQIKQAEGTTKTVGNQLVRVRPGQGAEVVHTAPPAPDNTLVEVADPTSPTGSRYVPRAQAAGQPGKPPAPPAPDNTLVEVADETSPTGTRLVPRAQAAGMPGKPPSGMSLTSDGKGGFTMTQGRGAKTDNAGMAQPTINKIEEDITNNNMRLDRLYAIVASFDPKYMQFGTQITNWGAAFAEKAGVNLNPQTRADLAAYTKFRSDAFNDLTRTLKEMSGAAVTPQEAERLLKSIGDPSNDSPTEFKAKLDSTVKSVRLAQARLHWLRKNGLGGDKMNSIGLEDMDALIGNRMRAAEAQFKEQGLPEDQAYEQARRQTAQEFGMKI